MRRQYILTLLLLLAGGNSSWATPILLSAVPNYYQSDAPVSTGCAPNSAATILGYWDLHGYDLLFDATGWEQVRYTVNVQDHISSVQHRNYRPTPGSSYTPPSPPTALTDYMKTSTGNLAKGWTYIDDIGPGISQFTQDRGYTGTSAFTIDYISALWDDYVYEIDRGNPVLLIVDSDSDGEVDHAVAGIGYDLQPSDDEGLFSYWFAFYDSFSEHEEEKYLRWYEFLPMQTNRAFGIYSQMITVHTPGFGNEPTPTPEPMTLALFALGISTLAGSRCLQRKFLQ